MRLARKISLFPTYHSFKKIKFIPSIDCLLNNLCAFICLIDYSKIELSIIIEAVNIQQQQFWHKQHLILTTY